MLYLRSLLCLGLVNLAKASRGDCTIDTFQSFLNTNGTDATVVSVRTLQDNGTFLVTGNPAYPKSPTSLRALCAVEVNVTSEAGTYYSFGLFLPEDWNERFLAVGNGGYAGAINWIDMAAGVGYGFATMSTDTGHNGSFQETTWAYGNPESITNWGWRAMHGSTVTSKMLISAWYGMDPLYSYFCGCSVGGRQGLRALQLFPDDFDGVSAGAPAWWTTHLQLWAVKTLTYNSPAGSPHSIPETMFEIISDEVVRQCDPQDGLIDTVISSPQACVFNPLTLLCYGNSTVNCLQPAQIDTLYHIYNDWVETNQTYVFSHYLLGTEQSWSNNIGAGAIAGLENQSGYARDLMQLGPNWTYHDLTYDTVQLSDKLNPGNATANDFDISPFFKRGGKLLHHHGLADSTLPTGSSLYFYEHVLRTLAQYPINVDDFYRLFLIPGMGHCQDTPTNQNAPWYIAGANQAAALSSSVHSVPGFSNSRHDILLALMNWVENGTAPNDIIATKWVNDTNSKYEVARQRPICKFPQQARFIGSGDPNLPQNWECSGLY